MAQQPLPDTAFSGCHRPMRAEKYPPRAAGTHYRDTFKTGRVLSNRETRGADRAGCHYLAARRPPYLEAHHYYRDLLRDSGVRGPRVHA